MPEGSWIPEDKAQTLFYQDNPQKGKLDTAYLEDDSLVVCGADLCSILEEKQTTLNTFLKDKEKFLLCSKGFEFDKGRQGRRFMRKADALDLIRSVKYNDRESDLDVNDFWEYVNEIPEFYSNSQEDFKFIENRGATYVYEVGGSTVRVRMSKGVNLVCLEDLKNVCEYEDMEDSPLSDYMNNSIKTYFIGRGGQCLQYKSISTSILMQACADHDFNNRDTVQKWLESLGEKPVPARDPEPVITVEVSQKEPESSGTEFDLTEQEAKFIEELVNEYVEENAEPVKEPDLETKELEFKREWKEMIQGTIAITRDWEALPLNSDGYKIKSPWVSADLHAPNWEYLRKVIPCLDDVEIMMHPSDAYLWVNCPASSRAIATNWKRKYLKFLSDFRESTSLIPFSKDEFNATLEEYKLAHPVKEPGPEDECHNGTVRHNISAALLKSFILKEPMTPEETMEFANLVSKEETILDYVRHSVHDFKEQHFEECYIEEHLPLPFLGEEVQGRSDLIFRKPEKIKVIDFKSGDVLVDASESEQLKIYAYATLANKGINPELTEIELQIVQPSIDNYSKITMTPRELMDWGRNVLMPRARAVMNPTVDDLHYGSHCKRCPNKDCRLKYHMEER